MTGTGTQIGDSTEMKALGAVFRSSRSPGAPLYVYAASRNLIDERLIVLQWLGQVQYWAPRRRQRACRNPQVHYDPGEGNHSAKCLVRNIEYEDQRQAEQYPGKSIISEGITTSNHWQVPHSAIPWPSSGLRRVSVNSFGFGGSNSHCIIDDAHHTLEALSAKQSLTHLNPPAHTTLQESSYDVNDVPRKRSALEVSENLSNGVLNTTTSKQPTDGTAKSSVGVGVHVTEAYPHANGTTTPDALTKNNVYQLLVYSAREEAALKRIHQQNASYYDNLVQERPDMLRNLAYTLATRRSLMVWRSFAVGNAALPSHDIGLPDLKCVRSLSDSQLCLVFTGQGAQYAKMGLDLVEYPVFKATLTEADKVFRNLGADWSLFGMQFPNSVLPLSVRKKLLIRDQTNLNMESISICPSLASLSAPQFSSLFSNCSRASALTRLLWLVTLLGRSQPHTRLALYHLSLPAKSHITGGG